MRNGPEPTQTVSVLTLQFSDIIELLSYYDKMRRMQKRIADASLMSAATSASGHTRRASLDSFGSF